jgi:hypothetical protein
VIDDFQIGWLGVRIKQLVNHVCILKHATQFMYKLVRAKAGQALAKLVKAELGGEEFKNSDLRLTSHRVSKNPYTLITFLKVHARFMNFGYCEAIVEEIVKDSGSCVMHKRLYGLDPLVIVRQILGQIELVFTPEFLEW